MVVTRALFILFLVTAGVMQAAPVCASGPTATLTTYIGYGSGGCYVGYLLVKDFSFSVLSSGGGATVLGTSDIEMTPTVGGPGVGVFSLGISTVVPGGFSVTGTGFVKYLIGYTWDPRDIRSMDDVLVDPVTSPGLAKITTDGCVGAAFVGSTCSTFIDTVTVMDDGISPVLTGKMLFPPGAVPILGIRDTIELDANGKNASFDKITTDANTPEPATLLTAAAGLGTLLVYRRRRTQSRLIARQMILDPLSQLRRTSQRIGGRQ